jgi:uncharacterized protein
MPLAGNWGGHGLHLRGNVEGFVRAASARKWLEIHLLEHWTHFYTRYGVSLQKRFFDYFLKDTNNGWKRTRPCCSRFGTSTDLLNAPRTSGLWRAPAGRSCI